MLRSLGVFMACLFSLLSHAEFSDELYQKMDFVPHIGSGIFSNYLAKNINFKPVNSLKKSVENECFIRLKDRGEAHITVINPLEYLVLKDFIAMDEINNLFSKKVQEAEFKAICLGMGEKVINGKLEKTYYLVIDSEKLKQLRHEIKQIFVARGGISESFQPEKYYPHITVGFSLRDLHMEDGIIKDKNSCVGNNNFHVLNQ